jgi:predicted 3-demethylubiquinone-9 3-methyltransferase (glyoxalase superfamily)
MKITQKIAPCLWFDDQAEEAANFYTGIFKNSRITKISHYGKEGHEIHGRPAGSVLTVAFELDGQAFTALNGGPVFKFNEAISLQIYCDTQEEIDHYWNKLSAGGDAKAQQCGWLKDKYGGVMAGHARRSDRDADRPGCGQVRTSHESHASNEEARHGRTPAGACGVARPVEPGMTAGARPAEAMT